MSTSVGDNFGAVQAGEAWVTLATNDTYAVGALVLAHSLRSASTSKKIAIMVTPDVSGAMRKVLSGAFDHLHEVNVLDSEDSAHLVLMSRPELGVTLTKLHCWALTQYSKCVFMDADCLVLSNCDELFDREELSAAPDVGWPDCFNSGVFVFSPSLETYQKLLACAASTGSFDGGDQGLLNMFFSDWATADIKKHLPFIYNMCSSATYSYLPAYKWFGSDVKVVHFLGSTKPWHMTYNWESSTVDVPGGYSHLGEHLQRWWDVFTTYVKAALSGEDVSGLAASLAEVSFKDVPKTPEQLAAEDRQRRERWERGEIDYTGADRFENILAKMLTTLAQRDA